MKTARFVRYFAAILLLLGGAALWWVWNAGPVTVNRLLACNASGIDDYRIFPQRRMHAPPIPFRFRENRNAEPFDPVVSFGSQNGVPLSRLLQESETTAFLVIRRDTLLYERYFGGHSRSSPSMCFSMTKSFLSMLVGCAIEDGYLQSVEQPVTDYVPELKAAGFAAVKLRHLLQMTSGMDYAENDLPWGIHPRFYYTDRLEREILGLRLRERPGTRFTYKSGDALLLALVLQRALRGKSITRYMQERLWQPLGMEHEGVWSIDHAPDGLEKASCCLAATARDFAKLGRLYLHRGAWNGRRIMAESWVNESARIDSSDGSSWKYHYMWWLVRRDSPEFMARGHLGQFLYVNPGSGFIIVRLGTGPGGLGAEEWVKVFRSLQINGATGKKG
ncbi:MAG: serine hydrolase [Chlorobi bacterium]|nr:serine hydrolase [Chlorobiota bacterium]